MKEQIFISYRREDTSSWVQIIRERLVAHFGDSIFVDTRSIDAGDDFSDLIEEKIKSSKVFLPVIGKNWLSASDKTGQRLFNLNDLVRKEISLALSTGNPVIPVLVGGANMPQKEDLPEDISNLAKLNAIDINTKHLDSEMQELIGLIESKGIRSKKYHSVKMFGLILVFLAAVVGYIIYNDNHKLESHSAKSLYYGHEEAYEMLKALKYWPNDGVEWKFETRGKQEAILDIKGALTCFQHYSNVQPEDGKVNNNTIFALTEAFEKNEINTHSCDEFNWRSLKYRGY